MLKISIPTPCHEDWEAMTPNTQGRHCNSCVKTVVDFTHMTDEEVKHFFLHKKEERVCGRFKAEQIQRITIQLPGNIFIMQIPFWKKFLAASLLVFSTTLFSCDTTLKGEPLVTNGKVEMVSPETIGAAVVPVLSVDTAVGLPPKVCTITVESAPTMGIIAMPVIEQGEPIIKADVDIVDTIPITKPANTQQDLIGKVMFVPDRPATKDPKKVDSANCDKQVFY